jgi:hypothetical protein
MRFPRPEGPAPNLVTQVTFGKGSANCRRPQRHWSHGATNELIDREAVMVLQGHLIRAAPGRQFGNVEAACDGLDPLNLRARSDLIRDALIADLPDDCADVAERD